MASDTQLRDRIIQVLRGNFTAYEKGFLARKAIIDFMVGRSALRIVSKAAARTSLAAVAGTSRWLGPALRTCLKGAGKVTGTGGYTLLFANALGAGLATIVDLVADPSTASSDTEISYLRSHPDELLERRPAEACQLMRDDAALREVFVRMIRNVEEDRVPAEDLSCEEAASGPEKSGLPAEVGAPVREAGAQRGE
jgi:hypothetical protein